jgi:hypothetical protein
MVACGILVFPKVHLSLFLSKNKKLTVFHWGNHTLKHHPKSPPFFDHHEIDDFESSAVFQRKNTLPSPVRPEETPHPFALRRPRSGRLEGCFLAKRSR